MIYEVVLDRGETPNKCTIAPLEDRPDFRIFRIENSDTVGPLRSPILLHPDGDCITSLKSKLGQVSGIASIDCVWRRLDLLLTKVEGNLPVFARIPSGFETAYPRRNKKNLDPCEGLATIEAIFVSAAVLGRWDPTLFSKYYFGRKFIEINRERFIQLGVQEAKDLGAMPILSIPSRSALQRRHDRGRIVRLNKKGVSSEMKTPFSSE